jgi:hypothetical protein
METTTIGHLAKVRERGGTATPCTNRNKRKRDGLTTSEHEWLKTLQRKNLELERANESPRKSVVLSA